MLAPLLLAAALILPAQVNAPPADDFQPDPTWKPLDKGKGDAAWFDPKTRRLILRARVCLREGFLEHLLCSSRTKEHEAVLATTALPLAIKTGLTLTGAKEGHPVRYRPEFAPPAGDSIKIALEWVEDGKTKTADAREFVKDSKTDKILKEDWVFAGSDLFPDPDRPGTMIFAADGGDLFTVANFTSAILDVPLLSSGNDDQRSYVANTAKIPPKNTYVTMYLTPTEPPAKPK